MSADRTLGADLIAVETRPDRVAVIEFGRPPSNFFDVALIRAVADAYEELDEDPACRAIVLCSSGKHFCAGADFSNEQGIGTGDLYEQAIRLFSFSTPVVAAVQGAAVGGGLGLALSADFRVASSDSRFSANFARLGIHHGFGLTVTLPAAVGMQSALDLLYTGRRVRGVEAHTLGLCDRLAASDQLRAAAIAMAGEITASAPQAVRAIRRTMRGDLRDRVRAATEREAHEQASLFTTEDFAEGIAAAAARRQPQFTGL
jgi:enoyl-CoA hydratase/carnithine racemase